MIIKTPISLGELIDKISILRIKKENIEDDEKQKSIDKELKLLNEVLESVLDDHENINEYLNQLIVINTKLWKLGPKQIIKFPEVDLEKCNLQKTYKSVTYKSVIYKRLTTV